MSRGRFLFVAWIALLLIGCGGDEATKPSGRTDFAGEWSNVDPDTPSITRIRIVRTDAALRLHMWGRCHPEDCDWGESDVPGSDAEDGQLSVAWDMGFCEISQILELENDGRLRVDSHTDYVDPGRPDQDATDWFSRSVDSEAPQAVSDLRVTAVDARSVTLSWTAPEDSGPLGRAASYDLRFGRDANLAWSSLTEASGEPTPAAAGTTETFQVTGLASGHTYVFRIKSVDAAGNGSAQSNTASGQTPTESSSYVLVGTESNGVWYSEDGGRSWQESELSDFRHQVGILVADPDAPDVVWASSGIRDWSGQGVTRIYRSQDRGKTFDLVSEPALLTCTGIQALAVQSAMFLLGTAGYAPSADCNGITGDAGGVFRSTDGVSWTNISAGLPKVPSYPSIAVAVHWVWIDPDNPNRFVIGTDDFDPDVATNGLFESTDQGATWAALPIGAREGLLRVSVYSVGMDPSDPARAVACTRAGIFLSENRLQSWTRVADAADRRSVVFDPQDASIVYVGSNRSTDGGRSWSGWTVPAGVLAGLAIDPATGRIFAAGFDGVFTSDDNGETWSRRLSQGSATDVLVLGVAQ